MYTVGMETDTRAYFTGVTILISLPTGTKIFNWLCTYLGNSPLLYLWTSSSCFGLLFLLMFTIGGTTCASKPHVNTFNPLFLLEVFMKVKVHENIKHALLSCFL
jgi:heme/copper-type cytochrome/quinol oxidase subunit 1